MEELANQLKRIADAIFQLAQAQSKIAREAKRNADVAEEMLKIQNVNLAVTKALEAELIAQGHQIEVSQ